MGIESMPIWTDGPDAGGPAIGMRGLVEDIAAGAACDGGSTGGGVMSTSCIGPEPELGGRTDVGITVGPMAAKGSGGGGVAVFATPMVAGIISGGGVGGYMSGGGMGLCAGAAPAWSLAPHPRQNL
jgi:hypothetical protein